MSTRRISVITTSYNSAQTIEATLDSVASQTYQDFEHLVIDGGSADGTLDILRNWKRHKIRLVSEPDEGIYDAMNKGVALATGKFVGFLNSDDVFADTSVLQQVARAFQDNDIDACYADLVYVDRNDVDRVVRYWKSSQFATGMFARGWCPAHPTFYVRRKLFESLGCFDLSYRLAADADLMMRFLERGRVPSKYVPEVWIKMRLGGQTNRNIRNIVRQNIEILQALRRHGLLVSPVKFAAAKLVSRLWQRWGRPDEV